MIPIASTRRRALSRITRLEIAVATSISVLAIATAVALAQAAAPAIATGPEQHVGDGSS